MTLIDRHRRDRPVGGQHARPVQRRSMGCAVEPRAADRDDHPALHRCSARSSARSTGFLSPGSGCRRWRSRSARSRSTAGSRSWCSATAPSRTSRTATPAWVTGPRTAGHPEPADPAARAGRRVRRACCTPRRSAGRCSRSAPTRRPPASPASGSPAPSSGCTWSAARVAGAGRCAVDPALLQRPRRQRLRPGAGRRRRRAARRGLHLRRRGHALAGVVAGAVLLASLQNALRLAGRLRRGADHRHRRCCSSPRCCSERSRIRSAVDAGGRPTRRHRHRCRPRALRAAPHAHRSASAPAASSPSSVRSP